MIVIFFSSKHILYNDHGCESSYRKDIQVPVCPLCNQPIPVNRGELPDIKVGQHIDRDCQSDPAKAKRKVYTNKCSTRGCKQKELVPIICRSCGLNYCLKHRHPVDHKCGETCSISNPSSSRNSPMSKLKNRQENHLDQRNEMSEDEALALALHMSLNENGPSSSSGQKRIDYSKMTQEEADAALAKALAESEREAEQSRQQPKKNCSVS